MGGNGGMGGMGGAGGGSGGAGGVMAPPNLNPDLPWYGTNRETLDTMIDAIGQNSASYDPANKPVAVFDWDNTVIKNDIGDLFFFWQVAHDLIMQPKGKNWQTTSRFMTDAANTALKAACDNVANEGMPLSTSMAANSACADELIEIYTNGKTMGAAAAFAGWNYRTMEPTYAWAAELQAGHTPANLMAEVDKAIEAGIAADVDAKQTIGTHSVNAWVEVYKQIKDLIDVLQKNGVDVWVLSASPQANVEAFGKKVNVAADHVVGIRSILDGNGKLTYDFQGCGTTPDGSGNGTANPQGNTMITYIAGKRCWMNKIMYGKTGADAEMTNADPKMRPAFGAGDSDTDIEFLKDATVLKLAINRNKKELMCNAYGNYMNKWIVNPMFIKPNTQQMAAYPCSTTACKDAAGVGGPCSDEAGMMIPDQMDTVF